MHALERAMQVAVIEASRIVEQGGAIVWLQLALAFFGMVFIAERMFFFHRARVNVSDLMIGLRNHARKRAFAEARHEAARAPGRAGRHATSGSGR